MTELYIAFEEWKELIFPDIRPLYEISSFGRVRRKSDKRLLALQTSEKGYIMVGLMSEKKGRQATKKLHRIVAYNFLGVEEFDTKTVNHINGDKTDNSIFNVEYVSFAENIKHSYDNGLNTPRKGTLNGMNKYSLESIERACVLLKEGKLSVPKIVDRIKEEGGNISFHVVHDIKRGKVWKEVRDKIWK